jgi:predicted Rossmann fold flavoprotein
MKRYRIGIIGGGASGIMAAITAAGEGMDVTLLEGGERIGRKILMTGNGRCNLSNLYMDEHMYYGANRDWIMNHIRQFDVQDTIAFCQRLGLLVKDKNGYLYPYCEQASVLLDAMRFEAGALGVKVVTGFKVDKIQKKSDVFVVSAEKNSFEFDRIIIACGGKAAPKTGSDGSGYTLAKQLGHTINPVVPALVQLRCEETFMKSIAGVRAEGTVKVMSRGKCIVEETGEIQFTDYGISGIPVFQISRVVNYMLLKQEKVTVKLDLLPGIDDSTYEHIKINRKLLQNDRTIEELFNGILNKKIMALFIKLTGLKPQESSDSLSDSSFDMVLALCKNFELHVYESNSFEQAQVCAGGVNVSELTDTLESSIVPGAFFAGEIIDVDGKCGGYNLQWAWSSGYIAAIAASK